MPRGEYHIGVDSTKALSGRHSLRIHGLPDEVSGSASLIQRLGRATVGAGMQIPTFVHLRGNTGSVLAAPGQNDLVLVALAGLDANLGLARLEMLDAVGRLS